MLVLSTHFSGERYRVMYPLIDLEQTQMKQNLPEFRAGDTVRVQVRLVEGNRERGLAHDRIMAQAG